MSKNYFKNSSRLENVGSDSLVLTKDTVRHGSCHVKVLMIYKTTYIKV